MATAIRIKLADLLAVLAETAPDTNNRTRRHFTQLKLTGAKSVQHEPQTIDEGDLRAIQKYLKNNTASRRDLEFHLSMTKNMVLRRLDLLKERGVVKHLPGNMYGLVEASQ